MACGVDQMMQCEPSVFADGSFISQKVYYFYEKALTFPPKNDIILFGTDVLIPDAMTQFHFVFLHYILTILGICYNINEDIA